ncbi:ArsR/SmtB family transcription factor [Salibacterium aidingense]|uniref:ArsR/SmtB family transcription factor n=1 Tax=Salibacterium aidingense TaxID=384933 RepID=UPI00040F0030|nr:transcriptional regulator [Salibacterium aidingense]
MLELSINNLDQLKSVSHALSSEIRLKMIHLLNQRTMNIHELGEALEIPLSTAAAHVKVLEDALLIITELRPAKRGVMKVCTRNFDDIHIQLNKPPENPAKQEDFVTVNMPIGQYVDFEVSPTCGMANGDGVLAAEDNPVHFYDPIRTDAELIWTRKGYFEYKFPITIPADAVITEIQLSAEVCSEAPNYDPHWPSDISVWFNDVEIGTWTSPGDFGDRPGRLNTGSWGKTTSTQYGLLKTWKVKKDKTTIDDVFLSQVTVDDITIGSNSVLPVKIGIKDDAVHKGGINLFGAGMGDFNQDLNLKVLFTRA